MEVEVDQFSCITARVVCNATCSLFLKLVILAFSLAKTSVATNNTSTLNPSSPSATCVYSLSSVTFASPFSSFKIFDQSLLHFSSKVKFYWQSLLYDLVSTGFFSNKPLADSTYCSSQDLVGPINLLIGPDILYILLTAPIVVKAETNSFQSNLIFLLVQCGTYNFSI